ncbi:MAG: RES family NAD+ phosphorylase [Muribaculaceae bacterium]
MLICDFCFNDEEIKLAIRNESATTGICDVCGHHSHVIDADFFSDFFSEVLNLFEPNETGTDVVSLIQNDWNLFSSSNVGHQIIAHFISQTNVGFSVLDKVNYIQPILAKIQIWDALKTRVIEQSRFFTDLTDFDNLQLIQYNLIIPQNTRLYRARVIPPDRANLAISEMGCPPARITPAGRANPMGIPYLYLCQSPQTTFYEVRALYLDKLSIGTFQVVKDLKILDFTKRMSLYIANSMSSDLSFEISKYKLIQLISKDLSKPLRRFDTELEYVPTQLICEYCKLNKIDGIMFNSSLHNGGINVVLFDAGSAECTDVKTVEIKHVTIEN